MEISRVVCNHCMRGVGKLVEIIELLKYSCFDVDLINDGLNMSFLNPFDRLGK